jgi:cell wall assembly regulator SMI1
MNTNNEITELFALRQRVSPDWSPPQPTHPDLIREIKHAFGFEIPDAVLCILTRCAGADELWDAPEIDDESDIFCDYVEISFFDIHGIVDEYEARRQRADIVPAPSDVRGQVRPKYFDKRWVPFAMDIDAGRFMIDLNPVKNGVKGQVIWVHDEFGMLFVVADSLQEFIGYGRQCLLYQLGEESKFPPLPAEQKQSKNEVPIAPNPECLRIHKLWDEIVFLNTKRKGFVTDEDYQPKFYKGLTEDRINKAEQRLKVRFPQELRCSLERMGIASCCWRMPNKSSYQQIVFDDTHDMIATQKRLLNSLAANSLICKDVRFSALMNQAKLLFLANEAGFEGDLFFIAASTENYEVAGTIWCLKVTKNWPVSELTFVCGRLSEFLELGIRQIKLELKSAGIE